MTIHRRGTAVTDPAEQQRASEMRSIRLHIEDGTPAQVLKSLDERGAAQELVRQQYSGRYPFELIQNAEDAARDKGLRGRVRFVLTDTALIVADNGSGFGEKQIKAICSLGRSSKGPGTSIGHKGLGFKSVGEITDCPQIISTATQFQFDSRRVRAELETAFGGLPSGQRIPVYAFPFPLEPHDFAADRDEIDSLRKEGLTTVIRLPLHESVDPDAVAEHLVGNLNARLLLFLPSIDHLELRGTTHDFSAEVVRDTSEQIEHVYMETEDGPEEWLVYRGSMVPAAEILTPLGEAWSQLTSANFAVAVPLEPGENVLHPRIDEIYPLHVYFPTEEDPGLRLAVHAEWMLTMDRRRIANTPEATAFNAALIDAVTHYVASTVACDLVQRCDLSVESVRALIPEDVGHLNGAAHTIAGRWRNALASMAFLPLAEGELLGRPGDVRLLPHTIPDYAWAHRLSLLSEVQVLRADVEADVRVRGFIQEINDECEMTRAEFLSKLATPTSDRAFKFYEFLLAWRKRDWLLADDLKMIACVHITNGAFLAPAEQTIFFPRRDESLPDNLPVPIAVLYAIDHLEDLLRELGVRSFEWRDLISGYLIKILEREDADPLERERAMTGLVAYQKARKDSTEVGLAILGRVLVPARNWDGTSTALRPAARVYFGEDWVGTGDLEKLYGPFGEVEFLAADADDLQREGYYDLGFYRMLGVSDHPRLERDNRTTVLDSSTHPHRRANVTLYNKWLSEVGARRCPMNHDGDYQRLTLSYRLDRLEDLVATQDPRRLFLLWNLLAQNWGKYYGEGLLSTVRCEHRYHSTSRDRTVDSLFAHTLYTTAWVPVELGGQPRTVRPSEAWFESSEPPPRIRARIPRISQAMYRTRGGSALTAELGLIDASYPRIENLLDLLESVATEADDAGSTNREIELAARWVQRTIDDVLNSDARPHPAPEKVRVLARYRGMSLFTIRPPFADDSLLRDTWQHKMPVLLADNDSGKLTKYLGLTRLDDEVAISPEALNVRQDETRHRVMRRIGGAKPYIVALIGAENARTEARAIKAIRSLEVVVCERLILRYRYSGEEVERLDARCFVTAREDADDARRKRRASTAYIELDETSNHPDWFAVGSQLAHHLGVAPYSDAITMLLNLDTTDRDRMMLNRQITESAVNEARAALDLPPDDEQSSVLDAYLSTALQESAPKIVVAQDEPSRPSTDGAAPETELGPARGGESAMLSIPGAAEPPAVDYSSVAVIDAQPAAVDRVLHGSQNRSASFTLGATSSAPPIQSEAEKRRVGRRGEEVAFMKERERVAGLGLDPDQVIWQSKDDQLAPFDILSVDQDGNLTRPGESGDSRSWEDLGYGTCQQVPRRAA